jgi:hypothetical protein
LGKVAAEGQAGLTATDDDGLDLFDHEAQGKSLDVGWASLKPSSSLRRHGQI